MPYILGRNSVTLAIPAGQSIRVGNPRGLPLQLLAVQSGRNNGPVTDIPAGNTTYGPYAAASDVVLVNNGFDFVEYVVGASPALTDVVFDPSVVAITGGNINNTIIGATTRNAVSGSRLALTAVDSTGTPGNVTNNNANGRAAFAAAGTTVVVTNSLVVATDTVLVTLLGAADTTLTTIVGVTVAGGSFTVTGNAAATATKGFMFTVIKS